MKNKKIFFIILSVVIVLVCLIVIGEFIPIIKEKDYKNRVFREMQEQADDISRGIVGIIPAKEQKDALNELDFKYNYYNIEELIKMGLNNILGRDMYE